MTADNGRHLKLPLGQVKNSEIAAFPLHLRELPLFEQDRTDI
jgi:hypothetical protein